MDKRTVNDKLKKIFHPFLEKVGVDMNTLLWKKKNIRILPPSEISQKPVYIIDHIDLVKKTNYNRESVDILTEYLSTFRKRRKRIWKISKLYS